VRRRKSCGVFVFFYLYQGKFFEHFGGLNDTRQEGKVWHRLTDILFIVVSGIICGYDEWDMICD